MIEERAMSNWEDDLDAFLNIEEQTQQQDDAQRQQNQQRLAAWFESTVKPAFEDVQTALEKRGREVKVSIGPSHAHIAVHFEGREELDYTIDSIVRPGNVLVKPVTRSYDDGRRYKAEGFFRSGLQDYGFQDLTREEIRQHVIAAYKQQVTFNDQQRRES